MVWKKKKRTQGKNQYYSLAKKLTKEKQVWGVEELYGILGIDNVEFDYFNKKYKMDFKDYFKKELVNLLPLQDDQLLKINHLSITPAT